MSKPRYASRARIFLSPNQQPDQLQMAFALWLRRRSNQIVRGANETSMC